VITYDRVRELFDYRDDGRLIWKIASNNNIKIGYVAGFIGNHGYCTIQADGKAYPTHRLIYFWHHGYMPENNLDHINRIRTDNRIENLREASISCNARNTGNHKDNKSGVKGVCKYPALNKWQAYIAVNSKNYKLGYFDDFDEAVLTRLAAEQCLDWNNCDPASPAYRYALRQGLIHRRR